MNKVFARWQANVLAGLAVIMPGAISIVLIIWLFGIISHLTDPLLIFVPKEWTHSPSGEMRWYWSLLGLIVAILIVGFIGRMARHYLGRKMIQLVDAALLRVPLLNKIYGATKQINEAFSATDKSAFKQVVLVSFPRQGVYSLGFLTGEDHPEIDHKTQRKIVSIVIPTTPNPTTGYLVLLPEEEVIKLDMSVVDGMKLIISLGAISPGTRGALDPAVVFASGTSLPPGDLLATTKP